MEIVLSQHHTKKIFGSIVQRQELITVNEEVSLQSFESECSFEDGCRLQPVDSSSFEDFKREIGKRLICT